MRAPADSFERARSLRKAMTLPEVLLWQELRGCRCGGLRFRRQHPIGPYVLDFYCPEIKLAVEVDGAAHDGEEPARYDARRDAWLGQRDIRVMRLAARDVLDKDVCESILDVIAAAGTGGDATTSTTLGAVPRDAGDQNVDPRGLTPGLGPIAIRRSD